MLHGSALDALRWCVARRLLCCLAVRCGVVWRLTCGMPCGAAPGDHGALGGPRHAAHHRRLQPSHPGAGV